MARTHASSKTVSNLIKIERTALDVFLSTTTKRINHFRYDTFASLSTRYSSNRYTQHRFVENIFKSMGEMADDVVSSLDLPIAESASSSMKDVASDLFGDYLKFV